LFLPVHQSQFCDGCCASAAVAIATSLAQKIRRKKRVVGT
jgi:hypothetical protein